MIVLEKVEQRHVLHRVVIAIDRMFGKTFLAYKWHIGGLILLYCITSQAVIALWRHPKSLHGLAIIHW